MNKIYQDDVWSVGETYVNGLANIVRTRCNLPAPAERALFKDLVIIGWAYDADETGMPNRDDDRATIYFEDALEAAVEQKDLGVLVVSITGNGSKEWRYYTQDTELFLDALNGGLQGHPEYPIEIALYEDPDWAGLAEFVPDA